MKTAKTNLPSISWAIACDMRRKLDSLVVSRWPQDGLTRREKRKLARALGYMEAAREEIMGLQSSLSERSKLNGHENPAYKQAREINPL